MLVRKKGGLMLYDENNRDTVEATEHHCVCHYTTGEPCLASLHYGSAQIGIENHPPRNRKERRRKQKINKQLRGKG